MQIATSQKKSVATQTLTSLLSKTTEVVCVNSLTHHNYSSRRSPTKMKLTRKVKRLQTRLHQEKEKVFDLQQALHQLKAEKMVSQEFHDILNSQFSEVQLELLRNQQKNKFSASKKGYRYSELIKKFALTLQFYSARAYNFMRTHFSLPHPHTLQMWSGGIECRPGFLMNVLESLKKKVAHCNDAADAGLMFDGMSVKKEIVYNRKFDMNEGYIDYGSEVSLEEEGEEKKVASEVTMIMLVGQRTRWRVPIGYFLTSCLSAEVLSKLLQQAFTLAHDANIKVHTLTFDGAKTNIKAVKNLGMKYGSRSIDGKLDTSLTCGKVVYAMLDPSHLIKLARNCLADLKVLKIDKKLMWHVCH